MAAAGRRWQRCSSCGCRLMSASGQRPCWRSHGRGHHLPGRSTSIRALWRTAWVHESACWAVAVERWARRAPTSRRNGLFQAFVRYLTHLDLEAAPPSPTCRQVGGRGRDKAFPRCSRQPMYVWRRRAVGAAAERRREARLSKPTRRRALPPWPVWIHPGWATSWWGRNITCLCVNATLMEARPPRGMAPSHR